MLTSSSHVCFRPFDRKCTKLDQQSQTKQQNSMLRKKKLQLDKNLAIKAQASLARSDLLISSSKYTDNFLAKSNKKLTNIINSITVDVKNSTKFEKENIYKIGDWIYCEYDPNIPFAIRKIEALHKKEDGNIEAVLRCAFRRSDLPHSLLTALEKHYSQFFSPKTKSYFVDSFDNSGTLSCLHSPSIEYLNNLSSSSDITILATERNLTDLDKYQLKHRELFFSKFMEYNIPVGCFRQKCQFHLFIPSIDFYTQYIDKDDNFFYQMTYAPNQKVLLADRGRIRVGERFQAIIPNLIESKELNAQSYDLDQLSVNVWSYDKLKTQTSHLENVEKYLSKFKRLYQIGANTRNKLIKLDDKIKLDALKHLHLCGYNSKRALETLDFKLLFSSKSEPKSSSILIKKLSELNYQSGLDASFVSNTANIPNVYEVELWSIPGYKIFEEGINNLDKNFEEIRQKYFPSKPHAEIVQFYYDVFKSTNKYIEKRQNKRLSKNKDKLFEIYVPSNSLLTETSFFDPNKELAMFTCESCLQLKPTTLFSLSRRAKLVLPLAGNKKIRYSAKDNNLEIIKSLTNNSKLFNNIQCNYYNISKCNGIQNIKKDNREPSSIHSYQRQQYRFFQTENSIFIKNNQALKDNFSIEPLFANNDDDNINNMNSKNTNSLSLAPPIFHATTKRNPNNNTSNQAINISPQPFELCNDCWIYWKKYASYRLNNAFSQNNLNSDERSGPKLRKERIFDKKSMSYNCIIGGCKKRFSKRFDLSKHYLVVHAYILKNSSDTMKPILKQLHNFYFNATPLSRAARGCLKNLTIISMTFNGKYQFHPIQNHLSLNVLRQLARRSTRKEIDVEQIKVEWQRENRDIRSILESRARFKYKTSLFSSSSKFENLKNVLLKINIYREKHSSQISLEYNKNIKKCSSQLKNDFMVQSPPPSLGHRIPNVQISPLFTNSCFGTSSKIESFESFMKKARDKQINCKKKLSLTQQRHTPQTLFGSNFQLPYILVNNSSNYLCDDYQIKEMMKDNKTPNCRFEKQTWQGTNSNILNNPLITCGWFFVANKKMRYQRKHLTLSKKLARSPFTYSKNATKYLNQYIKKGNND